MLRSGRAFAILPIMMLTLVGGFGTATAKNKIADTPAAPDTELPDHRITFTCLIEVAQGESVLSDCQGLATVRCIDEIVGAGGNFGIRAGSICHQAELIFWYEAWHQLWKRLFGVPRLMVRAFLLDLQTYRRKPLIDALELPI